MTGPATCSRAPVRQYAAENMTAVCRGGEQRAGSARTGLVGVVGRKQRVKNSLSDPSLRGGRDLAGRDATPAEPHVIRIGIEARANLSHVIGDQKVHPFGS